MRSDLAAALAAALLTTDWTRAELVRSAGTVVQRRASSSARWLGPLADQLLEVYPTAPLDRPRELADVITTRPAAEKARASLRPRVRTAAPTRMLRDPWHLPVLHTVADLAALLDLPEPHLAWYADVKALARTAPDEALLHYRASWRTSASGGIRVLEAPKPRLRPCSAACSTSCSPASPRTTRRTASAPATA